MPDAAFDRLTSPRLVLRRFRADDIATFVRYRADTDVARFQSWENFTAEDGDRFYDWVRTQHPDIPGEWFQVAVALRDGDAMIGDCGLHALAEPADEVEIGFTLAPGHQGHGYASEAVACLLDYVLGRLGKSRATAITDVRNARSIAVLERLGFVRDASPRGLVIFKGEPCAEYVYRLHRADWASRSDSRG